MAGLSGILQRRGQKVQREISIVVGIIFVALIM
jgi:tetrahydromethanopterin S-methyltransferase subunit G